MTHATLPTLIIATCVLWSAWFVGGLVARDPPRVHHPRRFGLWPRWLQLLWHATTWGALIAFAVFAFFYWGVFDR